MQQFNSRSAAVKLLVVAVTISQTASRLLASRLNEFYVGIQLELKPKMLDHNK